MNEALGFVTGSGRLESARPPSGDFGSGQWEILERIARGATLSELLLSIVSLVEHQAEDMLCSILLFDPSTARLRHGAARRLPADLCKEIDGMRIGPSEGSCGMAAFRRQRVVVTDISTHPAWATHKQAFLAKGLLACWSTPILSPAGELLGTLGMYFTEARGPSVDECAWADAATHLAAIALSRARGERENERLMHTLAERVKELTLLHKSARLLQAPRAALLDQLQALVEMIPSGWRFPELCRARIRARDIDVSTPGFKDGPCKQMVRASGGEHQVSIEVVYIADVEMSAGSAFLQEEQTLLESLADLAGARIEKHEADHTLRAALAELRDKNQRLEFHARHMPLGYVVWNADRSVSEWNGAAEHIFGRSKAEVVGKSARELALVMGAQAGSDPLGSALLSSNAGGAGGTLEHVHSNGSKLVCEWLHAPLRDDAGDVIGYLSMAHDVTDRWRAEEARTRLEAQLRQAQRIQSLGTLAGGIAHDFNNILTAISGHAHLGLSDIEEERSPRDSLQAIQEASLRAVELVRRILTFSRHQEPERKRCNLAAILAEPLDRIRLGLPGGVELRQSLASDLPTAYVDDKQIQQVVSNLLSNAAHAVGDRGRIEVSLDTVSRGHEDLLGVPDKHAERYLRIRVSDSGVGMPETVIEHIFEPFFSTKPSGQGTGLGLSVVHGIVKAHGGFVAVRSQVGQGSRFQVFLPDVPGSVAERPPEPRTPRPPAPGVRVMYVDDEEPLVVLATRWLARLGYEVTGFSDSARALEAFKACPQDYDAVISDFSMPGISGLELVRQIMAVRRDIIVVMSSGYLEPEDRERAKALGALEVVLKPQSMAEFGRILHRILSERQASSPEGAPR
jgi:PAS domain S-box-containing protein